MIIPGERSNIKVTERTDMTYAAAFLAARKEVVNA
jgi:2-C-methyl-D-erythritol 4-phosphate cytidylyltransferase